MANNPCKSTPAIGSPAFAQDVATIVGALVDLSDELWHGIVSEFEPPPVDCRYINGTDTCGWFCPPYPWAKGFTASGTSFWTKGDDLYSGSSRFETLSR